MKYGIRQIRHTSRLIAPMMRKSISKSSSESDIDVLIEPAGELFENITKNLKTIGIHQIIEFNHGK